MSATEQSRAILVDDATELKSSEPDTPPYIETSQQTGSGKWTYYLTHWTFIILICNEIVATRSETKLALNYLFFEWTLVNH